MVTIILAIILGLIAIFALEWHGCGFIIITVGLVIGLLIPVEGYNDPIKEEIQLLSLTEEADKQYYLVKESDNQYLYKVKEKYENNEEYYEDIKIINSTSLELIEKEKCENPVIIKYKFVPKESALTFALGSTYTEYVIYVPEGSIIE